jgi:hypothetical protein
LVEQRATLTIGPPAKRRYLDVIHIAIV